LLGYPDQADQHIHQAVTLAQELAHPLSLAFAYNWAALLQQLRGEVQALQGQAEALMNLAMEQELPFWSAVALIQMGWAFTHQGQAKKGLACIRQGLEALRTTGAELGGAFWLGVLAEAYGRGGQIAEAHAALREAFAVVDKTGERFYEAELYRLKGALTLQKFQVPGLKFQVPSPKTRNQKRGTRNQSPTPNTQAEAEAEACFLKAIEIARQQQAKSWQLRAATSLARLWQQQGKKNEARRVLSEIYNWFTEGFDTKDLQETKALLAELG
jgi:predicted ATPase